MPYLASLRAGASLIDVFKAFPESSPVMNVVGPQFRTQESLP